jgi:hypothetical protein
MELKEKVTPDYRGPSDIGAAMAIGFSRRRTHISVTGRTCDQEILRRLQVAVEERGSS